MKLPKQFLGEKPPAWAMPIGRQEFSQFKSQVKAMLAENGLEGEIDWEKGGILLAGSPLFFGFQAVMVDWKDLPDRAKPEILRSFTKAIHENLESAKVPILERLDDLRIRLCSDNGMPTINDFVSQKISDHLYGVLMLEGPNAVNPVMFDAAKASGKSNEELLDLALANVWKNSSPQVSRKDTDIGTFTYIDCQVFGATMMMLLDRFTERNEIYWACAPCRDTTILLKPNSPDRDSLDKFFRLVGLTNQKSNYAIEPFILEWKDGKAVDLCEAKGDFIELKD